MKHYEVTISFSYYAETPQDAVKQFMANIPLADWNVRAKDIETGQKFTVDTETFTIEETL